MTKDRKENISQRIRSGQTGNVDNIIAELLLAILEELEKLNKKK